jgi:MBG domain (YGX type)/FG-GAP-like repeat/FG-GAP repeat
VKTPGAGKPESARVARGLVVAITPVLICVALIGGSAHPVRAAINPATTIQLPFQPNQVIAADINGDGKLDLIASGNGSAVLLGNGEGTFKPPIVTNLYYPATAGATVVGDFNGDGKLDLAVGSYYGGVTILLGNGDGTFGPPMFLSTDIVGGLSAADLNGDGRTDLVVTSGQWTSVYFSNGNGTFQTGPRYPSPGAVGVLLADFNGDGKTDMVRLNYGSQAQFFAGVGDGTFLNPTLLPFFGGPASVADMNGDGKPDIVIGSTSGPGGCVDVFLGKGDGSFANGGYACNGVQDGNPVVADFNGDGKADVVVVPTGAVMTMLGDGLGGLANASASPTSVNDSHWSAAGDFNADGRADLAVTNGQSSSLTIYLNDGGTTYPLGDAVVSPSSLAFGSVPAWGTSAPQAVTVTNPGPGYLYLGGRSGYGNFTQSNTCLPATLIAPGASCTVQVTFTPSTSGFRTGGMTIYDSAASQQQSVTFSGTGTINPSTLVVAAASGPQGGTVNLTGTLSSNGAPPATIGWVTLSLPNGWTGRSLTDTKGNFGWFGASLAGLSSGVYANGIKAVFVSDGAYATSSATADLTVTAPAPVITVVSANGTYGGSANLAATITVQGSPLSGLTLNFAINGVSAGSATTDTQGTATLSAQLGGLASGNHASAINVSFAGNSVYPSSSAFGNLVINPAPLTVTASSAAMTYGGAPPAITASYAGFVNGDTAASLTITPTCMTGAGTQPAAGSYATSCSGAVGTNYTIGYMAGSLTVAPATLTITASSATITYGGTSPAISASYAGFVNGETAASLTAAPTCTTTASAQPAAGSYPTSCSGAVDANYAIGYVTGSLTVAPAPLTVTATNQSRLFGASNPGLTATISGFVNGDAGAAVHGAPSCTTVAASYSPGGGYSIVCTLGTLSAANYTFGAFVPGTLNVGYTTIISGSVSSLTVSPGQSVLIAPGAVVSGPLNVQPGGALDVEGATTGQIQSSGAVAIRICGATTAKLTIGGTSSLVVVGDDEGRPGLPTCTGNKIGGPATINGNFGGVEFDGNTVSGSLTITGNTGTTPDGGTVDATGNTVGGKTTIQP